MPMMHIDGSNLGSGKASAWACVIELDRTKVPAPMHNQILCGAYAEGTIGRMELMALVHALLAIDALYAASAVATAPSSPFVQPTDVWTITTDSQFVANGFNEWMDGWAQNGWRKSGNKEVAHVDLWEIVQNIKQKHPEKIRVEWVRGHNGHPGNTKADEWANRAARAVDHSQGRSLVSLTNLVLRTSHLNGEFISETIDLTANTSKASPSQDQTAREEATQTLNSAAKRIDQNTELNPISKLTPQHGYVLVLGPSGYAGTRFRASVGRLTPGGRIVDHAGDLFTDGGEDATHFLPLPWNNG